MSSHDYEFVEYFLDELHHQREYESDPKAEELLNKLSSAAGNLLDYVESKED